MTYRALTEHVADEDATADELFDWEGHRYSTSCPCYPFIEDETEYGGQFRVIHRKLEEEF